MSNTEAAERRYSHLIHPAERRLVRTIEFRTEMGNPGAVTGIPERITTAGPLPKGLRVAMVSAGRVWSPPYQIPARAEVIEVTRCL